MLIAPMVCGEYCSFKGGNGEQQEEQGINRPNLQQPPKSPAIGRCKVRGRDYQG